MGVLYLKLSAALMRRSALQWACGLASRHSLTLPPCIFSDFAQNSVHRNLHVQEAVWFLEA
jgi:hypothetical protein